MITVVNKYKEPNNIYCGRGSILGNPYYFDKSAISDSKYKVATREEAIDKFREYFYAELDRGNTNMLHMLEYIKQQEKEHGNVNLGCYCKPKACHCDVIKEYLDKE